MPFKMTVDFFVNWGYFTVEVHKITTNAKSDGKIKNNQSKNNILNFPRSAEKIFDKLNDDYYRKYVSRYLSNDWENFISFHNQGGRVKQWEQEW